MVIKIFINVKLDCLRNSSYEVHADVTFIFRLIHHLQSYGGQQL